MHWIIQKNIFKPSNFEKLIFAFDVEKYIQAINDEFA